MRSASRPRYKPTVVRHNGHDVVVISAERRRQLHAEALCERFSGDFGRRLRLMDDDRAALLELLAEGLHWTSEDDALDRIERAAVTLMKRPKKGPGR